MSAPISVDLPHRLGAEEAKKRIATNVGGLTAHLPTGAQVRTHWEGDQMRLAVAVMGQEVDASLDVRESVVRVTVLLPPGLAFFGKAIEAALRRGAPRLLEDATKKS